MPRRRQPPIPLCPNESKLERKRRKERERRFRKRLCPVAAATDDEIARLIRERCTNQERARRAQMDEQRAASNRERNTEQARARRAHMDE